MLSSYLQTQSKYIGVEFGAIVLWIDIQAAAGCCFTKLCTLLAKLLYIELTAAYAASKRE